MARAIIYFSLTGTNAAEVKFETKGIVKKIANKTIVNFIEETDLKLHTTVTIESTKITIERTGKVELCLVCDYLKEASVYMKIDNAYEVNMINNTILLESYENGIMVIYQTEIDKEKNDTHQLKLTREYI